MNRPDICKARNHHEYLKKLFEHSKSTNSSFSHAYCARKLALSPSYLKNIFSGVRNLNLEFVTTVATVFKMNTFERKYFTVLVVRDQVDEKETRVYFEQVMGGLRGERIQLKEKKIFSSNPADEGLLRDSFLHLLHSIAQTKNFRLDPQWIKSCISNPTVTEEQIVSGYRTLLEKGFIVERNQRYFAVRDFVSCPDSYDLETFKIYRVGLSEVDRALENVYLYRSCGFMLSQLVVNERDSERILEAFNHFRETAMKIANKSKNPDRVIGISNNYLTLAKEKG
jgi:uncharacterized protein (TIGR02147 family)